MATEPTIDRCVLRGMIFDLDGTLVDSGLDFEAIRRDMRLPAGMPILESLGRIPAGSEKERMLEVLHQQLYLRLLSKQLNQEHIKQQV